MIAPIDVRALPPAAQKIFDTETPAGVKTMAARAVVPGVKPADLVVVVVLLAAGDGELAALAEQTLAKLPAPILNGALDVDLEPLVVDRLVEFYVDDVAVMERLVAMPRIAMETV